MEVLENLDSLLIDISNISNDYSYAYEVEEFIYKNIDDLLINVLNMSNDFEVIPNFDIKRGLAGFLLTKIVDGEEKCINYFYPFLGKVFEPVVETVNINDLMKFLSKHECYSCDSPKSLEMGFVHYDINLNKSFIKKIKISKIKDVGDYGDFFESAYDLAKVKSSVLVNKLQYEFEKIKSGF